MLTTVSRRSFLGGSLAAAAGLWLPSRQIVAADPAGPANPGGFRFVHLTDIHVQPELGAGEGFARCLRAVESLDPKPDFILTGGDLIYDASADAARGNMLFELYKRVIADNTGIPVHHCIGNHDVFGWSAEDTVEPDHPQYGKQMVREQLGLEKTYYAFDHKGWRVYVLDSIQPGEDTPPGRDRPFQYQGGIDPEQRAWLEADLAQKDPATPAIVVTHIPILTVTAFNNSPRASASGMHLVSSSSMCKDSPALVKLFAKHNVRLALSGHIHEIDRINIAGVTFICGGAVCGGWWKGPNEDGVEKVEEGFGIVDMSADGAIDYSYFDYGWEKVA